jgi:hypothetical protein
VGAEVCEGVRCCLSAASWAGRRYLCVVYVSQGLLGASDARYARRGNYGRKIDARCPSIRCCGKLSQPPRCDLSTPHRSNALTPKPLNIIVFLHCSIGLYEMTTVSLNMPQVRGNLQKELLSLTWRASHLACLSPKGAFTRTMAAYIKFPYFVAD